MHLIKLKPQSSYISDLRSDTLWGMLIFGMSLLYDEKYVNEIVNAFRNGEPPFLISSVFPFIVKSDNIEEYLFPKPISQPLKRDEKDKDLDRIEKQKKYKKIKWLNKNSFENFINGDIDDIEYFEKNEHLIGNKEKKNEDGFNYSPFDKEDFLKTSIDRLTGTTKEEKGKGQLHYSHEIYANGGLFFLLEGDISIVRPVLNFLQHYGFGGDRSTGKGFFNVDIIENFNLKMPVDADKWMTLSLYSPEKEEITHLQENGKKDKFFYDITYRSGKRNNIVYPAQDYEKNSIACFSEGSVFPEINLNYYGSVKTALKTKETIGHDILFNGYAFKIPVKIKDANNE